MSFADLHCHFQTGRSYVISGTGRNRVYGYRTGVQCNLGDIERGDWIQMVKDVIHQSGEQELYDQLRQHLKDQSHAKKSRIELEFKALELHAARIFDNELWVDFLVFNQNYRPEVIASTRLILIMPECCKKPGYLTQTRYEEKKSYNCCPHCGRWTEISLAKEVQYA
jgi:hypothetical protein